MIEKEWNSIHSEDLWVYNKLFLSRVLSYTCGPTGISVPKPDFYIVRPSLNLLGMGRYARKVWIEDTTDHFHPSEFWCEIFEGEHLSVDFRNENPILIVQGIKEKSSFHRWLRWERINREIQFPEILKNLKGTYEVINCEFIDNKLIEVQFRPNSDFRYGNSIAIPVWKDQKIQTNLKMTFVEDEDYDRKGFYIQ